jgi:hypothetical protein
VIVVFPHAAKRDDAIGLGDAPKDLVLVVLNLVLNVVENVLGHFLDGLDEFGLAGIAAFQALEEASEIDVVGDCHAILPHRGG